MDEKKHLSRINIAAQHYFDNSDDTTLSEVVEASNNLIRSFSRLYGGCCDREDLLQAGRLGLIKALHAYDPSKGALFSTYASHCISGEIRHSVRKQRSFYKPGCIAELQSKVEGLVAEHISSCGEEPGRAYIAENLRIREESVDEVMRAGLVSFDEIDEALIRSTSYESFSLPIEDRIILEQAINKLSDFNKRVIIFLFYRGLTQQQVAEKMGTSQKRVSRAKISSLKLLREQLSEDNSAEEEKR